MRSLSEQNHYEVLEVPRDADLEEIERAYLLAKSTYDTGSLAAYSLFGEGDAEEIGERIEEAFAVLSDTASRSAYDQELSKIPGESAPPMSEGTELAAPPMRDFDEVEEDGEFDGARLRRARLRRGLDLQEIANETKINPSHLQRIEEERFGDLPAAVYVRGFVNAYARCLGLDAALVVPSFMERYETARSAPRRTRRGER